MSKAEFRKSGSKVLDWIAEYLDNPEKWPVLPNVKPGDFRKQLPKSAPKQGESMDAILADFERIVPGATTHWNHPMFLAYFANTGSAPGVLAEALIAALNVNAMIWKTGPAASEMEEVTTGWLRELLGLPDNFMGTITDTASSSTLYALAAAREFAPDLRIREEGMSGRNLPRLMVYASSEAHSSVAKAMVTLGLGLKSLRSIPTDSEMRMDPDALAAAIREDRALGNRPLAVVATVGTTSTTAIDPVPRIAEITQRENLWLHVDTAYGGSAAVVPEMRWVLSGCDQADSIVVNPHKWLFTQMDCSILYTSRPDLLKRAFDIAPDILHEPDDVINLMDYGVSLGRRFRALKLWFVLRYFGAEGLAAAIREHVRLAKLFASWVQSTEEFELLTPVNFSTVVFRHRPKGMSEDALAEHNEAILNRIHATRELFLSHTLVRGAYALRIAIGNLNTEESHVRKAWDLIRENVGKK